MRTRELLAGCLAVCTVGCQFQHGTVSVDDASDARDASVDAKEIDAGLLRVRSGLIGFWTFDDPVGSTVLADTSGTSTQVPLRVITSTTITAPTLSGGVLTASLPGRIISPEDTHLPADCQDAGGVTLEAWIQPSTAIEGTASQPRFVAGLAANISSRNVAILHAGGTWVGRVRTTAAADGTPSLVSTSLPTATEMTHIVVVADATSRMMYVNAVAEAVGVPGPLVGWDLAYPMLLIDEYQHARQWTGSIALVALYSRALSAAEVHQNFSAGPQ